MTFIIPNYLYVLSCKLECKLLKREFNAYLTFYKWYTNVLMNFYNRFYSFYKLTLVFILSTFNSLIFFLRKYKVCQSIFGKPRHLIMIFLLHCSGEKEDWTVRGSASLWVIAILPDPLSRFLAGFWETCVLFSVPPPVISYLSLGKSHNLSQVSISVEKHQMKYSKFHWFVGGERMFISFLLGHNLNFIPLQSLPL